MQSPRFRWVWPVGKILLALAILGAVGHQFWRDLSHESLTSIEIHWEWLILSGLLYVLGLGFSGWYWYRLLVTFGAKPHLLTAYRAYYISQLGKYLPGKAWAVMIRGTLVAGPNVNLGVALITTFYEVLTTMASGALLAVILLALFPSRMLGDGWNSLGLGLLLVGLCGLPLLPGVFNRIVKRLAKRFQNVEAFQLPRLGAITLIEGLATTSAVWICFGFSLWALVQGLLPSAQAFTVDVLARYIASVALACVGGFVIVVVPGGMGVREWVLDRLLAPELAAVAVTADPPATIVIVLLLRVTWTAAELLLAALWWLRLPKS